jgi:YihY family inner membrane protein
MRGFLLHVAKELFQNLKGSAKLCRQNQVVFLASTVAFFSLFSMCPFLIVCFMASHAMLRSLNAIDETPNHLKNAIDSVLPSFDARLSSQVQALLKQSAFTNTINLLLMIWAAYELFRSLNYAFGSLSPNEKKQNRFWVTFLSVFCFFVMTAITTFLLFLNSSEFSKLQLSLSPYFQDWSPVYFRLFVRVMGGFSVLFGISTIFKLMPRRKVSWHYAFWGSLLFLCCFALGHAGFTAYGRQYMAMNQGVYGPFIALIMVSLWTYYTSFVFLFSAQYTIYLEMKANFEVED